MCTIREVVADLDCVRPTEPLLLDNVDNPLTARQQKCANPSGTVAAISAISSSEITPGPLGMLETKPSDDAPHSTASAASSTLLMQQIFTRGTRVAFISFESSNH